MHSVQLLVDNGARVLRFCCMPTVAAATLVWANISGIKLFCSKECLRSSCLWGETVRNNLYG